MSSTLEGTRASALPPLTRRDFLQASVAAGGGLLLVLTVPRAARATRATARLTPLNAYVRIGTDSRATVIMPKVEMGQGTYTSLPMLVAEELELPVSAIDVEHAPPDPAVYGFDGDQSTGGSTTIRLCYLPLRRAGAAARAMLVAAAAKQWSVPQAQCHAQAGQVIHTPSGRTLAYGAIASAAAAIPVPDKVPLKQAADFRVIGRTTPRRDTPDKTTGRTVFGIDVQIPGMRVATVAFSPVEGGKVAEPLNTAAALAVPGVLQVVNEQDLVAVVAADTWSALQGMKALDPKWEDGPHAKVEQAQLVADLEASVKRPGGLAGHAGEAGAAMKAAAMRKEATYQQPFLAHATLEPMNCTVHWRARECEIWVGTQDPGRMVAKLKALGLEPKQVILHNHLIGGGFGRRLEVDGIVAAARIARHVDAPVKVLWTREEDIRHDMYRPYYLDRVAAGLDAQGQPVAWTHTITGSAVSAVYSGEPLKNGVDDDAVECAANPIYTLKNRDVRFVQQEPPGVRTSWWRGVGPTRSVYVLESFIDELAFLGGHDPVEYRRGLIQDPRLTQVLALAAGKAGWGKPLPKGHGRGVALQFAFGSYMAQVTEVSVEEGRLRLERVVCALDCGQVVNPDSVHAQMQGGVLFGLGHALWGEITFKDGRVQQSNFHNYRSLRINEAPKVETYLVESREAPGGVGETGTSLAAAALCNAIHAATGERIRVLPVSRSMPV